MVSYSSSLSRRSSPREGSQTSDLERASPVHCTISSSATNKRHSSTRISRSRSYLWAPFLVLCILCVFLPRRDSGVSQGALQPSNNKNDSSEELRSKIVSRLQANPAKQCSIFVAHSSIKGSSGFGIFTARDIPEGESILHTSTGPDIPLVDYRNGPEELREARGKWAALWLEYFWDRGLADDVTYAAKKVGDFQVGFGSLPNHHCILDSLTYRYPTPSYDDSLVDRFSDPGAGAFTYNMGRDFVTTRSLEAGEEIFLNYGYCYNEDHNEDGDDWKAMIPQFVDFETAAQITFSVLQHRDKVEDVKITVPDDLHELVASLVPATTGELREITSGLEIEESSDLIPILARHRTTTPRTPEWVRSNGICLENLVPAPSTIHGAGQGGFAQYHIDKGDIVVPVPMMHIMDDTLLKVYDDDMNSMGWQVLLNYCFGHPESSVLLCPETNSNLINHCSDRKKQCGPNGPNAEYRWSTGWEPKSDEWRKMSMDELAEQPGRGLSMEIVALRDIAPGEEVFIDYGPEWERAWERHVSTWKPPAQTTEPFITAKEANEQEGPLQILVTGDLRKIADDSHYLFTGCHFWPNSRIDNSKRYRYVDPSWMDLSDEEILERFSVDGSRYESDPTRYEDRAHWPCSVIRHEGDERYTVRIHQPFWLKQQKPWEKNDLPRLLTNYPREAIRYYVKPYAGDQHLPGVFRYPIIIRDELFPEPWKNHKRET